jgi:hypothetical protein
MPLNTVFIDIERIASSMTRPRRKNLIVQIVAQSFPLKIAYFDIEKDAKSKQSKFSFLSSAFFISI